MSFEGRRLQIPACHSRESGNPSLPFHQGTVVHRYPDRRMAVFHGAAQAGRVRVRRRPGGRRRAHCAGLCRSGSLNVPPVRSPRLGMALHPLGVSGAGTSTWITRYAPRLRAAAPRLRGACLRMEVSGGRLFAAARYCGWLGLATPMDTIRREVPNWESAPVRGRSASAKRGADPGRRSTPPRPPRARCETPRCASSIHARRARAGACVIAPRYWRPGRRSTPPRLPRARRETP